MPRESGVRPGPANVQTDVYAHPPSRVSVDGERTRVPALALHGPRI